MKSLILFLALSPFLIFSNDRKIPSKIKEVTVYVSGAEIKRSAICSLPSGTSEITLTGLSTEIDEGSIQLSGLQSVSILSMSYAVNYLVKTESHPETVKWEAEIKTIQKRIAMLKNGIAGLENEEQLIATNRLIGSDAQELDLEKLKQVSVYYRKRIAEIKNEIFEAHLEIDLLNMDLGQLGKQLAESSDAPRKQQGEIHIKFDAPVPTVLDLEISYTVQNAGWIPTYDIRSTSLNAPLQMSYKANVYQKTGVDWTDVKMTLSTGNPKMNITKPNLGIKYLDFVNGYQKNYPNTVKKRRYVYNPMVKKVVGTVTDPDGSPLPGCNVMIKGTRLGTQTDFDGRFSLEIPHGQELVFSYLGHKTMELPIYSSVMNTSLEEDAQMLEEVVVTGMGIDRNNSLGYAVTEISQESALQGKVAGVQVRGTSSLGNHGKLTIEEPKLPLYIIDGIPVDSYTEGDLDENEIQSIEVLNGENATALYGSRGNNGAVMVTTRKSTMKEELTDTKFVSNKSYTILSNGDLTAIGINTFELKAQYEYLAAPIINENVFLTASFTDWEQYNLLPGEANIYFAGSYAGKTTLDPYTVKKEMVVSLGMDPNITVNRKQRKNFKSRSFTGSNRILDRTYDLEVKNNKSVSIDLKLMDRIPISQHKEIKVENLVTNDAEFEDKKGFLVWKLKLSGMEQSTKSFSFQVKYPKHRNISL